MRRIGEDHRKVLLETHFRARPYAEVAAELGVPEGTIKSRVYYGLKACGWYWRRWAMRARSTATGSCPWAPTRSVTCPSTSGRRWRRTSRAAPSAAGAALAGRGGGAPAARRPGPDRDARGAAARRSRRPDRGADRGRNLPGGTRATAPVPALGGAASPRRGRRRDPGGVRAAARRRGKLAAQEVHFASVPNGVSINATLEPHAFGTEIQMYVKGIRSGTLCRVFLRDENGGPSRPAASGTAGGRLRGRAELGARSVPGGGDRRPRRRPHLRRAVDQATALVGRADAGRT